VIVAGGTYTSSHADTQCLLSNGAQFGAYTLGTNLSSRMVKVAVECSDGTMVKVAVECMRDMW
jgi:hypothetical protein